MVSMSLRYRGVMFDPARLTEKHSFYFDLLPYLAEWGYNTIWWHFTDDQGCALRFKTRPELASRNAFSREKTREFVSRAHSHGLEVIPELESFGHTGYITGRRKYRRLFEAGEGARFNGICPSNPETLEILEDLIHEVSELFPSEYLHAGFDEVNFGSCPRCRKRLEEETAWEMFARHVGSVRRMIGKNGKKMMMWGDHLLTESRLADRVAKDIVICDWHYWEVDSSTVEYFLEKGFKVVCCPALINAFKIIHPRESNLQNLKAFAEVASRCQPAGVVGVMNTVWCPYRHLQGAVAHGIALGGHLLNNGGREEKGFSEKFVTEYFGMTGAEAVGKALRNLYAVAPELLLVQSLAPLDWDEFEPLDKIEIKECERMEQEAADISTALKMNRDLVRKNSAHYDDILASAEIMGGLAANGKEIDQLFEVASGNELMDGSYRDPRARELLRSLADRTRSLHARACDCWNRTRFEDETSRDGSSHIYPGDVSLLYRLKAATRFFENLLAQPAPIKQ